MVTMVKILVAIIKIQIFFLKMFVHADQLAYLYEKLEELEKQQEEENN